jgi:site-specific DNA recombinase
MTNSISTVSAYYARTSTEEQREKETIQSQISALETEIRKSGEALAAKYIDDGHSGAVLDRPALDQLRADASGKLFTKV